jgi:hypothetical protein
MHIGKQSQECAQVHWDMNSKQLNVKESKIIFKEGIEKEHLPTK